MVTKPQSLSGRLLLLAACVGAGAAIAIAGHHLTGEQRWFLAIPACLAVGWLFVGDPEKCTSARCRRE
jgi:hypothetical protein